MIQRLSRPFRILNSRARNLSFHELMLLIANTLFKSENIIIYAKDLDTRVSGTISCDFEDRIVRGDAAELEDIRRKTASPPWEFCCHIYDKAKDFFIFKNGEGIGHISWIYYKGDPNRIINLEDDEAEIKYSLTADKYRGKGLYPATLVKIQRYMKDKGYRRLFICVDEDNRPSIRGIQKAGFELASRIRLIKVMGIQVNRRFSSGEWQEK